MSSVEARLRPRRGRRVLPPIGDSQASTTRELATFTDGEEPGGVEKPDNRTDLEESAYESEGDGVVPSKGEPKEKRPTKKAERAKISKTSASTKDKKKAKKTTTASCRGKKSLSLIFTMPMDVLFEILSLLSPKDLLSIYETNKQFYELLTSPQATFVWKRAREADDGPDPTPDMSEPGWAMLIYGSTRCDACGRPNAQHVDFWLRRRLCLTCKKKRLVRPHDVQAKFPLINQNVLKLIPSTRIDGWHQGGRSLSIHYWDSDIRDISEVLKELEEEAETGDPVAQAKLKDYKKTRRSLVIGIGKKAETAYEWYSKKLKTRAQAKHDAGVSRQESICKRFEEMGYSRGDIWRGILKTPEVDQKRELTERIWNRIRPILEERIKAAIRERVLSARKVYLNPLLEQYMRELPPNTWINYPETMALFRRPELHCLLDEADSESVVRSKWHTEVLPRLPRISERWLKKRKDKLRKLALPGFTPTNPQIDPLTLAIAVFGCDGSGCQSYGVLNHCYPSSSVQLYGWNDARFHLQDHNFIIFEDARSVVKALLEAVNLDPHTTTAEFMDQDGHLFYCDLCSSRRNQNGAQVYNWREAVQHSLQVQHRWENPRWGVFPSKYHNSVVLYPRTYDKCWSCNHCGFNTDSRESLEKVKSHLVANHQIRQPKEGVDLILFPMDRQYYSHRLFGGSWNRNSVPTFSCSTSKIKF